MSRSETCVHDVGRHRAAMAVAGLFGERERGNKSIASFQACNQAGPLYPQSLTYRRGAANRRFGPKPGIASFSSIDYDDQLIVASLF